MDKAVEMLKKKNLSVYGMPCHVGLGDDRQRLIDEVFFFKVWFNVTSL